jgi:flagellar capping protein FliD
MRLENSTLTEECREQLDAIKDLAEWKIKSMEMLKNQLRELESTIGELNSIQQLTK